MTNKILLILIVCIYTVSCENKKRLTYKLNEKHIIVDSFGETGNRLKSISYLNDTTSMDGPSIYYYPNGKIEKWLWFHFVSNSPKDSNRFPIGGVYFDTDESLIKIGGSPIVTKGWDPQKDNFVFQLINPPLKSEYVILQLIDSFNNRLLWKEEYEPIRTDSTAWVSFPFSKIRYKHKYTVNYLLMDSLDVVIDSYTLNMTREFPNKE